MCLKGPLRDSNPKEEEEEEIASFYESMGLDRDEGDINELIEDHPEELTTEDLQTQQHTEVLQETGDTQKVQEVISTSVLKEMLGMWEKLSDFI